MDRATTAASVLCGAISAYVASPSDARACGGTFPDVAPAATPVEQTGPSILYVMGEDTTEVHIQIEFDPSSGAQRFGWVLPIQDQPDFTVGSEALLVYLLETTQPSFGVDERAEDCDATSAGETAGGVMTTYASGDSMGGTSDGPEIVLMDTVGVFDVVVLSGGSAGEVLDWLNTNDFYQDPAAEPILAEYLAEGYSFAAFRLTRAGDTGNIHPITLTFPNDDACIPLRLTRIAAVEDMELTTLFLAEHRVVPQTYKHVEVNQLKLDWIDDAANYKEVVTEAVNSDPATGKAFVTEYAGPVADDPGGVDPGSTWNPAAFSTSPVVGVIDELEAQGLVQCFGADGCEYRHPLLRGLLHEYVPVPDTVDEIDFYACLSCYEDDIDQAAWDGDAFGAALEERIVEPARHAAELLQTWPYLTRMYTTISPGEMTADPFFHENPDLPEVDSTLQIAERLMLCSGGSLWTLPSGDQVYVPAGSAWPDFDDEMPWERQVAEIGPVGAPMVLSDRSVEIEAKLAEWNCANNFPSAEECGNPGQDEKEDTGCGCASSPGTGRLAVGLCMLTLLGLRRRPLEARHQ